MCLCAKLSAFNSMCMCAHVSPAGIQPYTINGAKVLFLRSRPQPRAPKNSAVLNR